MLTAVASAGNIVVRVKVSWHAEYHVCDHLPFWEYIFIIRLLYHYDLNFSHVSQPAKKTMFKNCQNLKGNLLAILVRKNFRNHEPKVIIIRLSTVYHLLVADDDKHASNCRFLVDIPL